MRNVSNKTNCVRDEDARLRLGLQRPNGRIKGGEQLIGDKKVARRECSHERRLTGIGVTDNSNFGQTFPVTTALDLFVVNGIEFLKKSANTTAPWPPLRFLKEFAPAPGPPPAPPPLFGADNALTRRKI